jgi:hypothetical protein
METKVKDELIEKTSIDEPGSQVVQAPELENSAECLEEEKSHTKKRNGVSRRGLVGGAVAAVVVGASGAIAAPLLNNAAQAEPATKDDISKLEYELSMLTQTSSDAELTSHKVTEITADSNDVEYPSAKAVFNALGDKVDAVFDKEYATYILIIGEDGRVGPSKFVSEELSDAETLPVQNRVINTSIKSLNKLLNNLDDTPCQNSQNGITSGGIYKKFQETQSTNSFLDLENGVNYVYKGSAINGTSSTFSIKRFDKTLLAINQSDPSNVLTSVDGGASWSPPYGGW